MLKIANTEKCQLIFCKVWACFYFSKHEYWQKSRELLALLIHFRARFTYHLGQGPEKRLIFTSLFCSLTLLNSTGCNLSQPLTVKNYTAPCGSPNHAEYIKRPQLIISFVALVGIQIGFSPFSPRFFFVLSMWSLSWIRTCRSLGWSRINGCFISCSVAGLWLWFFTKQLSINDWNFFDLPHKGDRPTDKKGFQ